MKNFKERNTLKMQTKLCEKGLRYDLTVPFARYVVMHRDELQLPFKRTKYSQFGVQTVHRRVVIVSSISVMPM